MIYDEAPSVDLTLINSHHVEWGDFVDYWLDVIACYYGALVQAGWS